MYSAADLDPVISGWSPGVPISGQSSVYLSKIRIVSFHIAMGQWSMGNRAWQI